MKLMSETVVVHEDPAVLPALAREVFDVVGECLKS